MNYYAIFDRPAQCPLGVLFPARTDADAVRQFLAIREDSQSMVNKFPGDFDLYFVVQVIPGDVLDINLASPRLISLSSEAK